MDFCLDRDTPFSFSCRVCGRCCAGKVIMVGPHEVLGMSRVLGLSTTEFLARYADNGGTTLRVASDGRCVFVAASGCKVHPRRPLVCRLYPLGRTGNERGEERFALFPKEPECEAETGRAGTIGTFLESQGVGPYLEWSGRYGGLYRRMMGLLEGLDVVGKVEAADGGAAAADAPANDVPLSSWQDIDASLAEFCAAKGLAVPAGIEESIDLHIRAIGEWLDDLESRLDARRDSSERGPNK